MNTETMLALLRRAPFQPFEVRMSNGDSYQIRHPEMALLLKSNLIIGSPDADDFVFCSLLQVADVKAIQTPFGGGATRENGENH